MASPPKIVFGTAGIAHQTPETVDEMLALLKKHNVKELDTAYIYQNSEATLGEHKAADSFVIQTKAPGFATGALGKKSVLDGFKTSAERLGVESVDVLYLHSPDPDTPLEETLSAISQLYAEKKLKRFGLSNFLPSDIQKIYDIQKEAGSVLPTVFQGNYNAVSRHIEESLFPLLRKLGIAFYAYSPIAGGFLVKDSKSFREQSLQGRWNAEANPVAKMYNELYAQPTLLDALDEWEHIASDAGTSKAALAYRWIRFHSALKGGNGDAVIIGASKKSQLEETLKAMEDGPLDEKTVAKVEGIWKKVEKEAPLDNYNSYMGKAK